MDDVTIEMLISAVAIVAVNGAAIRYIFSELGKRRGNITDLFLRVDSMMTKQEIATLVNQCTGPIRTDVEETKTSLNAISDSILKIDVTIARMDERMKAEAEHAHNRRRND